MSHCIRPIANMRYQTLADDLHLDAGVKISVLALVSSTGLHTSNTDES